MAITPKGESASNRRLRRLPGGIVPSSEAVTVPQTNLVISPEPSEPERAAIARALTEEGGSGPDSAWWRRGIEEATGLDEVEEGS